MISLIFSGLCLILCGYMVGNFQGYSKGKKLAGCGCGACAYAKSLGKCPAMAVYYQMQKDNRSDIEKSLDAYRGRNSYK